MAQRVTKRYTVCLDANGGSFASVPEEAVYDEESRQMRFTTEEEVFRCFLFDLEPVRGSQVLTGLNTEPDGSGKMYARRDADSGIPVHDDIVLYAIWGDSWTLHLDYNGGHRRDEASVTERTFRIAKNMLPSDSTWYYTSDIEEPVHRDVHMGFAGWYMEGNDKRQYPSAVVYEDNVSMKAEWKEAWALTFHALDGSFSANENDQTEIYSCVKGEWLSTFLSAVNDDPERKLRGYSLSEGGEPVLTRNNYLELRPVSDMEYFAVYEEGAPAVTECAFRMDELYLTAGETHDLTEFRIAPKEAHVYTKKLVSDNEKIVHVTRKGLLSAVSPGECTVQMTVNRKLTVSLKVKVFADDEKAPMHVYHLYSKGSSDHMITTAKRERNALVNLGWIYDSIAFYAPQAGDKTCYRIYSKENAVHIFTTDENQRRSLLDDGCVDEGVCCTCLSEGKPVYRLHDPNAENPGYVHTSSLRERDFYLSRGYVEDGIAWYGL